MEQAKRYTRPCTSGVYRVHAASGETVQGVMGDVLIALIPALMLAVVTFGLRVLTLTAVSVAVSVAGQWLWTSLRRRVWATPDLSAAVTGVLLSFLLPVATPLWMAAVGAAFAILIVRELFGGRGKNIFNPALGGYAFLRLFWPGTMTAFTSPRTPLPLWSSVAVTAEKTPLMLLREGQTVTLDGASLLLGQHAGALGETAVIAILAGGVYLLWRRVLKYRISAAYILTVAALALLFPMGGVAASVTIALCGGTLALGAVFLATDPVTSPVSPLAQWAYGIGCGALTALLRWVGTGADGAVYAIMLMNTLGWLLDRQLRPLEGLRVADKLRVLRSRPSEREPVWHALPVWGRERVHEAPPTVLEEVELPDGLAEPETETTADAAEPAETLQETPEPAGMPSEAPETEPMPASEPEIAPEPAELPAEPELPAEIPANSPETEEIPEATASDDLYAFGEEISGGSLAELARKLGLSTSDEPEAADEDEQPSPIDEEAVVDLPELAEEAALLIPGDEADAAEVAREEEKS